MLVQFLSEQGGERALSIGVSISDCIVSEYCLRALGILLSILYGYKNKLLSLKDINSLIMGLLSTKPRGKQLGASSLTTLLMGLMQDWPD